jgi:hypothetical protein
MTGQVYQQTKWWDGRGIAARECTPMATRTTATVSFINDHGLGWPLGTGELPSG